MNEEISRLCYLSCTMYFHFCIGNVLQNYFVQGQGVCVFGCLLSIGFSLFLPVLLSLYFLMLGIYFKELSSSVVLTLIKLFIVGILPQGFSWNFNKEDFKLIEKLLSLF